MSVGSDSSIDRPDTPGEAPVVDYEMPFIPADQARDELGPLIDGVRWDSGRMAEIEALLKRFVAEDQQASSTSEAT